MRVGVFCPYDNPTDGGGYTYQIELMLALSEIAEKSAHQFIIFTHHPEYIKKILHSDQIEIVEIPQFPFVPCGLLRGMQYAVWVFFSHFFNYTPQVDHYRYTNRFEREVKKCGIECLWFTTPGSIPVNIPYLATVWDLQHRVQPFFPEVSAGGIWEEREGYNSRHIQRASTILVGTKTGGEEVERFYQVPTERIKVLPLPIPRFALTTSMVAGQDVLKKYAIPPRYLFYPAQFWSHKNHANLLLALKILRQKYNLILPLVLVGSDKGNENHIRKMITTQELSSQVHILGFVPVEDMAALYQNAMALTFVSFFGPDNLPPLEAFGLRCPVIASKVSGAEEQLRDAAVLVDPKSPEQIADAIFEVYTSPDLRRTLIERGLKRAHEWTGQDFIQGLFSVLDEFETIRRCWE